MRKQQEYTVYITHKAALVAMCKEVLLSGFSGTIERVTVHNPDKTVDKGFRVRIETLTANLYYL